jgi:hypothetical protein
MAWTKVKIADFTVKVKRGRGEITVSLQFATTFKLGVIKQFISKRMQWSTVVLEAVNFLNHLFSVGPTKSLIPVGRKFYTDKRSPCSSSPFLEFRTGLFQAVHFGGDKALTLNIDVTTGVFWHSTLVTALDLVSKYFGINKEDVSPSRLETKQIQQISKLLKGMKFRIDYSNAEFTKRTYTVSKLAKTSARQHTFQLKNEDPPRTISVNEHFRRARNVILKYPDANLLVRGDTYFPLELCYMLPVLSPSI